MRAGRLQHMGAAVERHPIARHELMDLGVYHLFGDAPGRPQVADEGIPAGRSRQQRGSACRGKNEVLKRVAERAAETDQKRLVVRCERTAASAPRSSRARCEQANCMPRDFLHNHPQFADLIRIVA